MKESSDSVHGALDLLTIPDEIEKFILSSDFKVDALATKGSKNHSCKFPCYICKWIFGSATLECSGDDCEYETKEACKSSDEKFKKCIYRTFAQNRKHYEAWVEAGAKRDHLKKFFSVERPPASVFDKFEDEFIVCTVPIDSLHVKLGLFGKPYNDILKLYPKVSKWAGDLFCRTDHWNRFAGNEVDKLLKPGNLDQLKENVLRDVNPGSQRLRVLMMIRNLHAVRRLIAACWKWEPSGFEMNNMNSNESGEHDNSDKCLITEESKDGDRKEQELPEWRAAIRHFASTYLNSSMSITTKAHSVLHHLEDLLEFWGHGLAPFNAQGAESSMGSWTNSTLVTM